MNCPDREALRAWDRAVAAFAHYNESGDLKCGRTGYFMPSEHSTKFTIEMFNCQLAGFASPVEVAFGGSA